MTSSDMLSINNVAAKLGLSVHQLRRWELMFGLEIKRGRGQQRQYREEDMSVLERIKELVEQGWPTSQIRPQLEAEGLLTPKLIGVPPNPGNPEVLQEAIIGLRNFSERRFIDLSKQIDELRQLVISVTLKQELSSDRSSPWQPMTSEYVPAPKASPPQEITIGPQIGIDPPKSTISPPMPSMTPASMSPPPTRVNQIPPSPTPTPSPATGSAPASTPAPTPSPSPTAYSGTNSSSENKIVIPDIDAAPQPSTDALQRSMSTLDSLFKDSRNTPGGVPSESTTPPVRHSTIPPVPATAAASPSTASTSSASSLPAASPASSSYTGLGATSSPAGTSSSSPTASTSSTSSTPSISSTTSAPSTPSFSSPSTTASTSSSPSLSSMPSSTPSSPTASTSSSPSVPSTTSLSGAGTSSTSSSPSLSAAPSAPSAWDQAFASTTVDANAVPSSGLFDAGSASSASSADRAPGAFPNISASSPNAYGAPAAASPAAGDSERNPFTTITGTNINALETKPVDAGGSGLLGQTPGSSQGFSSQNLNQTGPLPAHSSVESFAPEQKLIESQSNSTSTDLPEAPAAPAPPPALPVTPGPQVNFGPNVSAPTPQVTPQRVDDNFGLGEVTDQNYLTVLGRALDLIGWSDEQADSYSLKTFGVPHWDELGRSQAEKLVAHLVGLLKDQINQ
ncbi:MAG: MerR family transcriptional regulator [Cyanobacteria bacterium SZAS LIN-3]|nr:MerR family transcriptional regulator [Cyanobacteria bacterium SZAS LIN-3]